QLSGMRKKEGGEQLGDLARKGEELAGSHREFGNKLRKEFGSNQPGAENGVPNPKAQELAGENEALRQKMQELEREMQAAARDLAATDRETAAKIRRALGDMQGSELDRNMRMSGEAIRRGYGQYAAAREVLTTQALNNLRDRLKEAEAAGVKGGKNSD